MDTYKVALPSSLNSTVLDTVTTFCTNNSRPVAFPGLPKDICGELLGNLLETIFNNFRACQSPENLLVRATSANIGHDAETGLQRVVIAGASNLKHSVAYFCDPDLEFLDLSSPEWVPTTGNVLDLKEKILFHKSRKVSAFVFDLFGNSSVRFEQFDGSTALPFKSHRKYHLGGDVLVTPQNVFKKTVENIMPILSAKGDIPCVLVPPIPRYLFSRCCDDIGHCTNANKENYQEELLGGFLQLRNSLIKILVTAGLKNFKVLDTCCTTTCATTANTKTRLTDLRSVTAKDGVHYVAAGYRNLATRSLSCLKTMLASPPREDRSRSFFWRGFKSPRGSNRVGLPKPASVRGGGNNRFARGTPRGFHPYRRN
jgi:lysophospholipase L1-like esterase